MAGRLPASLQDALTKRGRQVSEARPAIWRRAAEIANEKPLLGEGPGSFGAGFRRHPVEAHGAQSRWALTTDFAHSEPLQAAAETGWAGLALWLLGLGASLSFLLKRADDEPAREAAAIAAAAMAAQGRWEAARALAEKAADDEPGFLNDRVLRAEALLHLGRKREARAELAGVKVTLATRGNVSGFTHYDAAIWELDRREYDRVARLLR